MKVNLTVIGSPAVRADGREVTTEGHTLADVRRRVEELSEGEIEPDSPLLPFVDGEAVGDTPEEVELKGGEDVLFVLPVSGG
jgi:hypothetical protein